MTRNPDQPGKEPIFSHPYIAGEISVKGVKDSLEAGESERKKIAAALDLAELGHLQLNFQLSRAGQHRFKLSGHMVAVAKQVCVVSLKPVETRIDEKFEVEFWPAEDVARIETEDEPESMFVPFDGPEPILEGVIDVGQLAYEHLAASLDPYPKVDGAQFEWNNPAAEDENVPASRPFAGLAKLKGSGFRN